MPDGAQQNDTLVHRSYTLLITLAAPIESVTVCGTSDLK
jgi:hypothetical protein